MNRMIVLAVLFSFGLVAEASASPQIYRGNNPRITPTANPFNADNIQKQAELTRPKDPKAASAGSFNESELLRRSVISSLSARYTSLLTGSSPDNGVINFGDGSTATYSTSGGIRTIVLFNGQTGATTTISFPL